MMQLYPREEGEIALPIPTPWGTFTALVRKGRLTGLLFPGQKVIHRGQWFLAPLLEELLNAYLKGQRVDFSPIPLDLGRATPFQLRVWQETQGIPYGTTITYGELALRLGIPQGARAVGQALKKNPIPIIIPCHRVVGKRGLTGFSGGLDWKRRLINLESGE